MKEDKIQTGLRIPEGRYKELCEMAERSGVSLNALILCLVDVAMTAVNLGTQAASHSLPHNQRDTF